MNLAAQLDLASIIVNYLTNRNYTRVSFDRLQAAGVGDLVTRDDFAAIVDLLPNVFRTARLRGGLRGLALVG